MNAPVLSFLLKEGVTKDFGFTYSPEERLDSLFFEYVVVHVGHKRHLVSDGPGSSSAPSQDNTIAERRWIATLTIR